MCRFGMRPTNCTYTEEQSELPYCTKNVYVPSLISFNKAVLKIGMKSLRDNNSTCMCRGKNRCTALSTCIEFIYDIQYCIVQNAWVAPFFFLLYMIKPYLTQN